MWMIVALVGLVLIVEVIVTLTGDLRRDDPTADVEAYLGSRGRHPAGRRAQHAARAHRESA